jgi:hypothetical protein
MHPAPLAFRPGALAAALLFAFSCSSAPRPAIETDPRAGLEAEPPPRVVPAPTPEDRALAERARDEAARHLDFQAELLWSQWVGIEPPAAYEPPPFLFEPRTVLAVERVAAHEDEEDGRFGRLHAFLAGEAIGRATRAEDERLRELRLELLAQGRAVISEPDTDARRRRASELLRSSEDLLPAIEAQRAALESATRALGWDSPFRALSALAGEEPEELLRLANAILQSTDSLWREVFGGVAAREIGLELEQVRWEDLPRIFHGAGMDLPLRGGTPEEALHRTLDAMRLSLDRIPRLAVDAEAREGKEGRPLCLPGPHGVRLAIPPGGGSSHRALLRDTGCAIFSARASEGGAPFPPEPVTRAFGGLFARISEDPAWLAEVGGMTRAEARARAAASALRRLYLLRHHAAVIRIEHERSLRGHDLAAHEESHARWMSRALGFEVPGAWARFESTGLLAAIDAVRGELAASLLGKVLGEGWWARTDAADRLHAHLEAGARGIEALLSALGRDRLDADAFVEEVRAHLELHLARS